MMKYIVLLLLLTNICNAQTYNEVLKSIAKNNKEIKNFEEYIKSNNLGYQTNNLPLNPTVEYSFLSANENTIGNKQTFSITQQFDFPTIYFQKEKIANQSIDLGLNEVIKYKASILYEAQLLLTDIIYFRKKEIEYAKRLTNANSILQTIQIRLAKGDAGILEQNKAETMLRLYESKLNLIKIELSSSMAKLKLLNGGEEIIFSDEEYENTNSNLNFESLLADLASRNLVLANLNKEKTIYESKLKLAKQGWLPSFGIGYRQENESNYSFKGVQLSMSIPIFENNYKVPKAETDMNLIDLKINSFYQRLCIEKKRLFDKSKQLESTIQQQKEFLNKNQLELNKKSYELGNISLTQYYTENTIYYEISDSILEIEKEYYSILSELNFELINIE